jgi:hypothetical protein
MFDLMSSDEDQQGQQQHQQQQQQQQLKQQQRQERGIKQHHQLASNRASKKLRLTPSVQEQELRAGEKEEG